MNKYFQNLRYILQHKWVVFLECRREGLWWRGIMHDISKLSLAEFTAYADYYFAEKGRCGGPAEQVERKYQYAWLHHVHHNKHHWNYWVVNAKTREALPMPDRYLREMCCDWRAMSRRCQHSTRAYYLQKRHHMILHPETRRKIEIRLGIKPADDSGGAEPAVAMPAGCHRESRHSPENAD